MPKSNVYAGTCNGCGKSVPARKGYLTNNGKWITWCVDCFPEKIQVRREMVPTGDAIRIYMPYEPESLNLIRSLPVARWNPVSAGPDKPGYWTCSKDMEDRIRVLEVAKLLNMNVHPSLSDAGKTEEAHKADLKGLYPFQVHGVNWLSRRSKGILGDDMGLGKTVQAIMSMEEGESAIVITLASLVYNWQNEINKWTKNQRKVTVIRKKVDFRVPQHGEIIVLAYTTLPETFVPPARGKLNWEAYNKKYQEFIEENEKIYPGISKILLVIDEIHRCKNRKAKRSQQVKTMATMSNRAWGLTGTPLENKPSDLYGMLDCVGIAHTTFGGWRNYLKLMNATSDRWGGTHWGTPRADVPERLRRVMLRRRREEVLPDLPRKTYTNLVVGCKDKALAKSLGEMWEKCRDQITTGQIPTFREFSESRAKLAADRISDMIEFVEEHEEQEVPLVVFSDHLKPLDQLMIRDGWRVISGATPVEKRQEFVDLFQAGKLKGLGVSILAGGTGLTLTYAWKALFVDLNLNPASNWQAEDRICRIGQLSDKVEIVRMVSDHPLDIHVNNLLDEKIRLIEQTVENVTTEPQKTPEVPVSESETNEEYQERMDRFALVKQQAEAARKAAEQEEQKKRGKRKVDSIYNREESRYNQRKTPTKPILSLTPQRRQAIKESFQYMLGVCDGAVTRDSQGFNKPDANVARFLDWAGLENDVELKAAYYMLTRYHRQLHEKWPLLWKDE